MYSLTIKLFRKIFDFSSYLCSYLIDVYQDCKKHIHAINVTIISFQYKNTISSNFAIWRSFLFSHVATLVYAVHVYEICICLGRGRRLFGSFPRKFWDEVVQVVQFCQVQIWIIHKRKRFCFLLLKLIFTLTLLSVSEWQCILILHSTSWVIYKREYM